ncbi:hypothetical protein BDV27DRAFT_155899 [Aspergillus caelatus]|uniref:Ricin B lectin domain-containing protein n=1 Tax=Aspergillus caelatus TaxID=61420 RepID=A0A5N7A9G4_9EURO|nr:uncharacterized protein BDV27DRAFT_155899 [Aspergillus caelatus]KAE8366517.1 hypothetical protein BDV27DRAFT_155899 [Aspergillus caelatus]
MAPPEDKKIYRIRCAKTANQVLELNDGQIWNRISLAKRDTAKASQKWKVYKTSNNEYYMDNEDEDTAYISPPADHSDGQLFASNLKPEKNEILRWRLAEDSDGSFKVENVAFRNRVVDVANDPATPGPGDKAIIYKSKDAHFENQRWNFDLVD